MYCSFVTGVLTLASSDLSLRSADEFFCRLMEEVDPSRDTVMVLAPYNRAGDRDLTAIGLRRPGTEPGYLGSASTPRPGFLTLVDIAPSVLVTFRVDRPAAMEGRPAEPPAPGAALDERVDHPLPPD